VRYIDGNELAATLAFPALVDALQQAHCRPPPLRGSCLLEHATGGQNPDGLYVLPAWFPGQAMGVKVITILPQNPSLDANLPAIHALYPIFDGTTGKPRAVIDGTVMTYWKTAADSALAARFLVRGDATRLLMVGAGNLAPWLVRAHVAIRPSIEQVSIWNRTPKKAEAVAAGLADFDIDAQMVPDLESAVRSADTVCCATSATAPLISGDWLQPGTHLDLVGGFTPEMRECDDVAVARARLFMDSEWFALGAGDLATPLASGIIVRNQITDLYELCSTTHPGRQNSEEITLFKNAGGGHLDLMTAMHILSLCEQPEPGGKP
jgi:alanine dehydrogenase